MSRWSPTVHPPPQNDVDSFLDDLATASGQFVGARAVRNRQQLADRAVTDRRSEWEQSQAQRAEELEHQRGRQAEADRRTEALFGMQGILPESAAGTRAPVKVGGRTMQVPNLTGIGTDPVDVTAFTPREGVRGIGGGYYYDPQSDRRLDERREREAAASTERAELEAALANRGYSPEDAALVSRGGARATDLGPLAAEADKRDVEKYRSNQFARALAERSGRDTEPELTPYQMYQLLQQDRQFQETRDQHDLDTARSLRAGIDPLFGPRNATDSSRVASADSIAQAVATRRAATASQPSRLLDMFGDPTKGPRNDAQPQGVAPPNDVAGANLLGRRRVPVEQRASELRSMGMPADQIKQQLRREGYSIQ